MTKGMLNSEILRMALYKCLNTYSDWPCKASSYIGQAGASVVNLHASNLAATVFLLLFNYIVRILY